SALARERRRLAHHAPLEDHAPLEAERALRERDPHGSLVARRESTQETIGAEGRLAAHATLRLAQIVVPPPPPFDGVPLGIAGAVPLPIQSVAMWMTLRRLFSSMTVWKSTSLPAGLTTKLRTSGSMPITLSTAISPKLLTIPC